MHIVNLLRKATRKLKNKWKVVIFFIASVVFLFIYMKNTGLLSDLFIYCALIPSWQFWNEETDTSAFEQLKLSEIQKRFHPYAFTQENFSYLEEVYQILNRKCLDGLPPDFMWKETKENFDILKKGNGTKFKKILSWNNVFGPKHFGFSFGHEVFQRACCKESRCFLTDDREQIPIEEYDAILFHFRGLTPYRLPPKRSIHQKWIFFELEPPTNNFQDPDIFRDVFNWTMTYRKDSDIHLGYGYVYPSSKEAALANTSRRTYNNTKREMVAWFVSHCGTLSYREHYARKLQKYVKVDVYGSCGSKSCSYKRINECYRFLEQNYKFYLSFENALCKDYVTEKFFNILRYDVVPVVYGFGDYKTIAPPHSYIDILEFANMKEVAEYLIYLDKNTTAYNEYLRWKKDYQVFNSKFMTTAVGFCSLCQRLHSDDKPKTYNSIRQWHMGEAKCKRIRPRYFFENLFNITIGYI